jgi:hypothetical protein
MQNKIFIGVYQLHEGSRIRSMSSVGRIKMPETSTAGHEDEKKQ